MDGLTATELRTQIKENALIALPNVVGKIQAMGMKPSGFLILITRKPQSALYTAGVGYQTLTGFKEIAHWADEGGVMDALRGLLDVMAKGAGRYARA
ncbi:hypothetical protein LTR56_005263 [Elasticomyces elasticus]|uniref:Uncharacterized protein n=1 Tax=Elasticomyces elasticus TaxID=574655 RepID=A0AAN7WE94_9PEZI|nr:hypothetical protein LTR56_005263 [Elasticomyces elasticus]KAK3656469.1 hypothetical protein LTR22_009742 [Elasticomyces elasticus]KAK4923639.1 hypothetical protein LTR49_009194 [Elasticomyces elasticus]KAK5704265.1 hypothetical protein LTR97_003280 [Elasticomyces elasticus]KAK5762074.1 hypothetical protein LTS12_007771 [Elasticomyces elasticus]